MEGKIGVVPCPNVGTTSGGIGVTGESHPLGTVDVGIVGNHAQSQLTPAVILEKMTIFYLGFFIESFAELSVEKIV